MVSLLFGLFGLNLSVAAHEARPIYAQLTELNANTVRLQWRTPESVGAENAPSLRISGCQPVEQMTEQELVVLEIFQCKSTESERTLIIDWPGYNPSVSVLVDVSRHSGERYTEMVSPNIQAWEIPDRDDFRSVARSYLVLGMQHIWGGIDHLLFLVCLCFIAGTLQRILVTITGFTLAHSLTLALSALDVLRLPTGPTEAAIALSILFLVREIHMGRRDTLTWQYPIAVSGSFGLLHGLGFASVLNEIGLPQTQTLTGLLMFNLGVEIGQIIVVLSGLAIVLTWYRLFRSRVSVQAVKVIKAASNGSVGLIASYWLIDRTLSFSLIQ